MTYTPPVAGSSNWDVPLNQALADIDALGEDLIAGGGATVATVQTTASTTYADLTTAGPAVSITLLAARTVLVFVKATLFQVSTTDPVYMSFAASGATTVAAADTNAVKQNGAGNSESFTAVAVVACNAGTTTFTAKYRTVGGSASFADRVLAVVVT